MREAGMASTGKHFPGHGAVVEDSHLEIPVDKRERATIWQEDIIPFADLIKEGLDAIMPAHVIYQQIDDKPAGFSPYWLQQVLRQELGFNGAIFSDDLSMEGASTMGGFTERAEACMEAGCDMFLMCNSREGVIEIIDNAHIKHTKDSSLRLTKMMGKPFMNRSALLDTKRWAESVEQITALV
jgi:beta-N-acetylhexosaminidase